ncbi:hypothetical protein ACJ72_06041 [Emergomyces africanus]|uniref:Uncharacterized protein n=1 Tax=Emergomyces africanus TaxID=1955775 RepID=A0A1B7NS66_9EURO|nr:hypothetical protein ACJ72_06041 [Emergomyces africanus]
MQKDMKLASNLSENIWEYNSTSGPKDDKALEKSDGKHVGRLAADELPDREEGDGVEMSKEDPRAWGDSCKEADGTVY